nr:cytochrome c [Gluconacetobacter tumulisoli]
MPPPASGARSGTVPVVPVVQGRYLIGCGGCHGVQGRSGQRVVPDLAGQVGYFLCTPEGREYLVRLPNVAFANLSSQDLADMVNFVVFTFGHDSLPAGTKPYTAAEIARLRADPLRMADLHLYRDHVVRGVVRTCPRARALHDYDTAQAGRESGRDAP